MSDADLKAAAPFTIADTASEISSVLDRLQAAGTKVAGITLSGSDAITLTAAQLKADSKTLNKIAGAYNLNVTGVDAASAATLITTQVKSGTSVGSVTSITISDTSAKIAASLSGLLSKADKISTISQSDATGVLSLTSAQMTSNAALLAKFDSSVKINVTGVAIGALDDTLKKANVVSVGLSMTTTELASNLATLRSKVMDKKISGITLPAATNTVTISASDFADYMEVFGKISSKFTLALSSSSLTISQLGRLDANALKLLPASPKLTVTGSADDIKTNADRLLTLASKIGKIALAPGSTVNVGFSDAKKYASVLSLVQGGKVSLQLTGSYSQYKVVEGAGGTFAITDNRSGIAASAKESGTLAGINFFKFSDITTFGLSGDSNVDAVLNGGQNMWWYDGKGAAASANDLSDRLTTLASGSSKTTLTYSFLTQKTVDPSASASEKAMTEMNDTQKKAVRDAFAYLSSLINVTFKESQDSGKADINFGMNVQGASAGYANPPHASGAHPSYLFLASNQDSNKTFGLGTYGWETLVHEIGHTMGLKHPFNGNAGGGGAPQPYLPTATNTRNFSIMSYTDGKNTLDINATLTGYSTSAVNPQTYMTYDIAALQYLYGQNTDETLYKDAKTTFGADFKGIKTIYSPLPGSIDASATKNSNVFDLRGGGYSSIGYSMQDQVTSQLKAQGASDGMIASFLANSKLKSALANAYNGQNNVGLAYGSHIASVTGGSGKDQFYVNGQDNVAIDGGSGGEDTVYLAGAASDWKFADSLTALAAAGGTITGKVTLTNGEETVTLQNVEKYAFYNADTTPMTHTS